MKSASGPLAALYISGKLKAIAGPWVCDFLSVRFGVTADESLFKEDVTGSDCEIRLYLDKTQSQRRYEGRGQIIDLKSFKFAGEGKLRYKED